MKKSERVLQGPELRRLREAHGLTRENVAEKLQVEVPTVWRWEVGQASPNLKNSQKLDELLYKRDAADLPFFQDILEIDAAFAILDSFAVFKRCNAAYSNLYGMDTTELEGLFSCDLSDFWRLIVPRETGWAAEDLSTSDVEHFELIERLSDLSGLRHSVTIFRMEIFSTLTLHCVEPIRRIDSLIDSKVVSRRLDIRDEF